MTKIAQGLISRDGARVPEYFDTLIRRVGVVEDYAQARNEIIKKAEDGGWEWLVFLDSDEELRASSVRLIKKYIASGCSESFALPRIEFARDREHYDDSFYPDWQTRIFILGRGFHYRNKIHESLFRNDYLAEPVKLLRCPIYHYGKCYPPEFIALKYINYERIRNGEPLLEKLPEGYPIDIKAMWKKELPFIE